MRGQKPRHRQLSGWLNGLPAAALRVLLYAAKQRPRQPAAGGTSRPPGASGVPECATEGTKCCPSATFG